MIPDYQLFHAVRDDNIEKMKEAIDSGANIHMTDNGIGLLETAQKHGSHNAARLLIEKGLDVDQKLGRLNDTLLHKCVRQGDGGMVLLLLQEGADPNHRNNQGQTPLDIAGRKREDYIACNLRLFGAIENPSRSRGRV